jgi:lysophospholipase L1-like esterase
MATFPPVDLIGRHKTIAFMGDSLTHNTELGVPLHLFFSGVVASNLRAAGYPVRSRNFGISGNTSTAMLARITEMTQYDIPSVAFVGTAINDVGSGFATTRANIVAMGTFLLNAGVPYVVIHGHHYQNFSGIDTVAAEDPNYAPLRVALLGAVSDLNAAFPGVRVSYLDTYAYFRGLIVAGTEVQDSASWHITSGNIHWNALGHNYMGGFALQHLQSLGSKVFTVLR